MMAMTAIVFASLLVFDAPKTEGFLTSNLSTKGPAPLTSVHPITITRDPKFSDRLSVGKTAYQKFGLK